MVATVERIKRKDKPVVVGMGGVAASDGYYVSAGADTILAEAGTIWEMLACMVVSSATPNCSISWVFGAGTRKAVSPVRRRAWDEVELAGIDNLMSEVYSVKDKVGEGRGLNAEEVEALQGVFGPAQQPTTRAGR